MRVIFIFLLALVTTAQAQQINPVPDYIFRNQMSVGRNAATDTAAYFSVGPRFGAVKGFMPPMVVDTNTVTGSKRNGLFIFSVQKNKYVYWDSVGAKWAEMAGTGGTAINSGDTAAMLLPYIRHAGYGLIKNAQALLVDTLNISTRAWRQKGIDSVASVRVGGSGITGYIPKWTATRTQDTSQLFLSAGFVAIGNTSPSYKLDITGTLRNTTGAAFATSSGNVLIGTTVDGGSYKLDVQGALRNTTGAAFATTSGNVGIGMTLPVDKLSVGATSGGAMSITTNEAIGTSASPITMDLNFRGYANNERARIRSIDASNNTNNSHLSFWTSVNVNGLEERMRLTHDNRLGIGTTNPSEALHVTGRIRATTIDSTASPINLLTSDANGVIRKTSIGAAGGVGGTGISGYFPKWTGASTQDTSQIFQNNGRIGIGTITPLYKLDVNGLSRFVNEIKAEDDILLNTNKGIKTNLGIFLTQGTSGATYVSSNGFNTSVYLQADDTTALQARRGEVKLGLFADTDDLGNYTLQVKDSAIITGKIRVQTIDSTATAINILYADANGVIKKAQAITLLDDVMTASGSWVATKDAGSGVTINNVAYTTNGTTKMVTIDGNFYIASASFSDGAWNEIGTIPAAYRPSKTVNWNSNFIVSGAEYERSDNTDFTGALSWTYGQMRIKDDGKVEVNASVSSNSIAAGGTAYIIVQFTQSYIIK